MGTPLMTDEEMFDTPNKNVKQSMEEIVKNSMKENIEIKDEGFTELDKNIIKESEKELEKDIPSNYIEVNLLSNGRIKGIPTKLHFRDYSASDALDLNVNDEDKVKAITKVLTRLNYEKFDISNLTLEDTLFILYKLHGTFISPKITKKVYIDDTIKDKQLLDAEENLEEVDIPINSIPYAYLGKDYDDNELPQKIKIPFTIKDKMTNESVSFKFTTLKDMVSAESYCRNYYKDKFIKYAPIRSELSKINKIYDEEKQDKVLDDYLTENEELANEYYDFMVEFAKMVAKIVQAETIVAYNGKEITSLDEQWNIYNEKLSYSIWEQYTKITNDYPFGFKEDIDVFLPSLKKKVHRRVGFQFDDFLHFDKSENNDRCIIEFD